MKYIIFEDFSGQAIPIIFPNRILHEEMREQLPYAKVVSAGYLDLRGGAFVCHGKSPGLKAKAREEDAAIMAGHFAPDSDA
jgi:hypothetical protein